MHQRLRLSTCSKKVIKVKKVNTRYKQIGNLHECNILTFVSHGSIIGLGSADKTDNLLSNILLCFLICIVKVFTLL